VVLAPGQRLVVVSPHLDDAAFSVGALVVDLSRAGTEVTNVTVFAGDPSSTVPAGVWDRRAGFTSAGAAAATRRAEDERASRLLGMKPVWLPFHDDTYPDDRASVWEQLQPHVRRADFLLIPGFPLEHPDHAWVFGLFSRHRLDLPPLGLYAEQPYSESAWFRTRRLPAGSPLGDVEITWRRRRPSLRAWRLKQQAVWAYGSQLRAMARPAARVPVRVGVYELWRGGECVGLSEGIHGR
jgi:LmbE family N-acetylglucosaminyl deacetylase